MADSPIAILPVDLWGGPCPLNYQCLLLDVGGAEMQLLREQNKGERCRSPSLKTLQIHNPANLKSCEAVMSSCDLHVHHAMKLYENIMRQLYSRQTQWTAFQRHLLGGVISNVHVNHVITTTRLLRRSRPLIMVDFVVDSDCWFLDFSVAVWDPQPASGFKLILSCHVA